MQNDCFRYKAEERGVAVATAIDGNAADEQSGKSRCCYLIFVVIDSRFRREDQVWQTEKIYAEYWQQIFLQW